MVAESLAGGAKLIQFVARSGPGSARGPAAKARVRPKKNHASYRTAMILDELRDWSSGLISEAVGDIYGPARRRIVGLVPINTHRLVDCGVQVANRNRVV